MKSKNVQGIICLLIFTGLWCSCNICSADIYKYVDDKGQLRLTNLPTNPNYTYILIMREKRIGKKTERAATDWIDSGSISTADEFYNKNEVKLMKNGGVYEVPVTLNNVLTIYFILDSGASDVSISPDVALTLLRTKTITNKDWLPGAYYKFADGTTAKSKRFKLKSVKIGNMKLINVTCSIANSLEAPMLLGQSALQKLRRYSIDYEKNVMIFNSSGK